MWEFIIQYQDALVGIGGFLLAATGGWVAYKRLNVDSKESSFRSIKSLSDTVATLSKELGELREQHEDLRDEMEKSLEAKDKEIAKLKGRIDRLVKQLRGLGHEPDTSGHGV